MAGVAQAQTNNPILDTISGLYNVAGDAFGKYSSFLSARETAKVQLAQASTPPNMTVMLPTPENGLNYLANPENLQKLFFYGGAVLLLTVGGYFVLKKI